MDREQRKREVAKQYIATAIDEMSFRANYGEYNYEAGARDAIEQFAPKAFVVGAEWADAHPKNPWISVKEQLPNVSQEVIVLTKNGKCVVSSMYIPKDCKGNILGSKEWKGSKTFKDSIVLWMPIPELTFDDILDANKDVLKRIKENGD